MVGIFCYLVWCYRCSCVVVLLLFVVIVCVVVVVVVLVVLMFIFEYLTIIVESMFINFSSLSRMLNITTITAGV